MTLVSTAIILLASGRAVRFEDGDKLTAPLGGKPVAAYAASCLEGESVARRIAVTGETQTERSTLLSSLGWEIIDNPEPALGQGVSLALGIRALQSDESVGAAMILLADMPLIPDTHLKALAEAMRQGADAVMTRLGEVICPPAIFARSAFDQLDQLHDDRGAKNVFSTLSNTRTLHLDPSLALDIDQKRDLKTAEDVLNG